MALRFGITVRIITQLALTPITLARPKRNPRKVRLDFNQYDSTLNLLPAIILGVILLLFFFVRCIVLRGEIQIEIQISSLRQCRQDRTSGPRPFIVFITAIRSAVSEGAGFTLRPYLFTL